jgi:hypothetical protein
MASAASKYELTDEERAKIIEKARRELPERDRRYREAIEGLRRVARGLPGRPVNPAKS